MKLRHETRESCPHSITAPKFGQLPQTASLIITIGADPAHVRQNALDSRASTSSILFANQCAAIATVTLIVMLWRR